MRNGHHHHHHHVRKKKKVHTIFMNQPNRQKKRRRHAHRYSLWEIHEAPNNNSNWFHDDNPLRQLMDVRFCEEKNNREEDGKEGGLLPKFGHMCTKKRSKRYSWKTGWGWRWRELSKKVTCAQKKGPNDIHEKQVEDENENDENCPKRSHVSKKKDQTIFMKNKLMKRIRIGHHHVQKKKVHTIFMNQPNRQREVRS